MSRSMPPELLSITDKMVLHSIEEKALKLRPEFGTDYVVRYPEAEGMFELDPEEAVEKLEDLSQRGYLRRNLQSNYMKCPACESFKLLVQLRCPHCNSFKIRRGLVFEHYDCGYQGFKEEFIEGDRYICPKCNKELKQVGVDFRRAGVWYHCQECDEYYGTPREVYLCLECNERYLVDELVFKTVWMYEGNPEEIKRIILGIELDELSEELEKYGDVAIFGEVRGKSSISHRFTLKFNPKDTSEEGTVVEIKFSDKPIPMREVTSFYAKLNDVEGFKGLLLAIPRLSDEAKNLAGSLGVRVIESEESEDVVGKLKRNLEEQFRRYRC